MSRYCLIHRMSVGEYEVESELEDCIFTSCPPPEFDMSYEWVDSLVPPTNDELLVLYLNSLELEADFTGEIVK